MWDGRDIRELLLSQFEEFEDCADDDDEEQRANDNRKDFSVIWDMLEGAEAFLYRRAEKKAKENPEDPDQGLEDDFEGLNAVHINPTGNVR